MKIPKPGAKYTRLTVVGIFDLTQRHGARVLCRCTCGEMRVVYAQSLYRKATKSCGCLGRERRLKANTKHGHSTRLGRPEEYSVWSQMKDRCLNKNNPQYKDYGGRGITVDLRWRSYRNFIADMGRRPSKVHTLERKKNELGYSKDNCVWATRIEQQNNMRTNHLLTLDGRSMSIALWAKEKNIPVNTLYARILTYGWSDEKALTTPVRGRCT